MSDLIADFNPTAIPNITVNQGVNGAQALDDNGNYAFAYSLYQQLPLIAASRAGYVRINFRLGAHYSNWTTPDSRGLTALQQYDNVVNAALALNLTVLGLLDNEAWPGNQTDWCTNNVENGGTNGDNTYLQNFSLGAAVVLASHFAGRISTWEVWNEPDAWTSSTPPVYAGGSFIYESNFAWLLHHVYNDTRNAGITGLTFISGGLFGNDLGSAPPNNFSTTYLTNLYTQGIANANWSSDYTAFGRYPFDIVGLHLYIDQTGATTAANIKSYTDAINTANITGAGGKFSSQIIITEIGWTTASISNAVQATNLTTAFTELQALPYIARVYWFVIQDHSGAYYGLYDGNGLTKPSLVSYQATAKIQPGTVGTLVAGSFPLTYLSNGIGKLVIWNDSAWSLLLTFPDGSTNLAPSWVAMIYELTGPAGSVLWAQDKQVNAIAPDLSNVWAVAYRNNESIPGVFPIALTRQTKTGGGAAAVDITSGIVSVNGSQINVSGNVNGGNPIFSATIGFGRTTSIHQTLNIFNPSTSGKTLTFYSARIFTSSSNEGNLGYLTYLSGADLALGTAVPAVGHALSSSLPTSVANCTAEDAITAHGGTDVEGLDTMDGETIDFLDFPDIVTLAPGGNLRIVMVDAINAGHAVRLTMKWSEA